MIAYLLTVIIVQWMNLPGYQPTVIIHHNRQLAEQEFAYYAGQSAYVVSMQKEHE